MVLQTVADMRARLLMTAVLLLCALFAGGGVGPIRDGVLWLVQTYTDTLILADARRLDGGITGGPFLELRDIWRTEWDGILQL